MNRSKNLRQATKRRHIDIIAPSAQCSIVPLGDGDSAFENLSAGMTQNSREVLSQLVTYSDCTVRTSDGVQFQLSKCSLTQHLKILGSMIRECETDTLFKIPEDGKVFSLLLDVMYSKINESPLDMHNVESILELARKYDMGYATDSCDSFLSGQPLACYIERVYVWAAEYELPSTVRHCRAYVAANFNTITERHYGPGPKPFWPIWVDRLTPVEQIRILKGRICATHKWNANAHQMLTEPSEGRAQVVFPAD